MRLLSLTLSLALLSACGEAANETVSNETGGTSGVGGSGGNGGTTPADAAFPDGAGGSSTAGSGGQTSDAAVDGSAGSGGCLQLITAQKSPTTITNDNSVGSQAWSNPANALASDDVRATSPGLPASQLTHRLVATGFGFQVPTNATIQGIELLVERSRAGTGIAKDASIRILKAGAPTTDNPIKTTGWALTTDSEATYGGATSLWGTTWTPADVSATDFGAFIRAQNTHATDSVNPRVDSIKIRLHYQLDTCSQ